MKQKEKAAPNSCTVAEHCCLRGGATLSGASMRPFKECKSAGNKKREIPSPTAQVIDALIRRGGKINRKS